MCVSNGYGEKSCAHRKCQKWQHLSILPCRMAAAVKRTAKRDRKRKWRRHTIIRHLSAFWIPIRSNSKYNILFVDETANGIRKFGACIQIQITNSNLKTNWKFSDYFWLLIEPKHVTHVHIISYAMQNTVWPRTANGSSSNTHSIPNLHSIRAQIYTKRVHLFKIYKINAANIKRDMSRVLLLHAYTLYNGWRLKNVRLEKCEIFWYIFSFI